MNPEKVYKTSDQGFATYLWVKGHVPLKAIPAGEGDTRRKAFIFHDVPNSSELERLYDNFQPDYISPKDFAKKWRAVTRIAREGLSDEDIERLRRG